MAQKGVLESLDQTILHMRGRAGSLRIDTSGSGHWKLEQTTSQRVGLEQALAMARSLLARGGKVTLATTDKPGQVKMDLVTYTPLLITTSGANTQVDKAA